MSRKRKGVQKRQVQRIVLTRTLLTLINRETREPHEHLDCRVDCGGLHRLAAAQVLRQAAEGLEKLEKEKAEKTEKQATILSPEVPMPSQLAEVAANTNHIDANLIDLETA